MTTHQNKTKAKGCVFNARKPLLLSLLACVPFSFGGGPCIPPDLPAGQPTPGTEVDSDPRIAMDGSGNAILVGNHQWSDGSETKNALFYNVHHSGSGWEYGTTGNRLTDRDQVSARNPAVCMDASGNGIVVWEQEFNTVANTYNYNVDMGMIYRLFARRYIAGTGWQSEQLIDTYRSTELLTVLRGAASSIQVAMDGNGNVMVVWLQGFRRSPVTDEVVNLDRVWATRYDAATDSWLPSPVVISNTGASSPRIGMDSNGNAIAVWVETGGASDNPVFHIFANRYEPANGWIHSVGGPLGNGKSPQISMGSAGSAMAVWNDHGNIWARRYASGSDWEAPQTIGGGSAENPQIAMMALGLSGYSGDTAMAVWQQPDGWSQPTSIYACLWDSAAGWHAPELIESGDGSAYDPQAAISAGNGVRVVWRQHDSPGLEPEYHIYANRFALGSNNGWEGERRVESGDWWDAYNPQLAWDASGVAIAAWDDGLTALLSGGLIRTYVWDAWGAWGPPTASFTRSPVSPRVDQAVDFDASGSTDNNGSVVSYEWDFDDDGTIDATGVTATHTYTASGAHTVRLRVTDNDGLTDETTQSISIGGLLSPSACFTFTPSSPQVGESVSFDAGCSTRGDGTLVQYQWDFNNDGIYDSGLVTTTWTWAAPGTHTVALRVTDINGQRGETSQSVNVDNNVAAEICNNGIDDDGDTLVDCEDPECIGDPACPPAWDGACCLEGAPPSCHVTIQEICQMEGGFYQGDGTTCTPNPCP